MAAIWLFVVVLLRHFYYDYEDILSLTTEISFLPRCKPDAETFNALIHTHARAGQWRWATNIMEDMLRAAVCILFPSYLIILHQN